MKRWSVSLIIKENRNQISMRQHLWLLGGLLPKNKKEGKEGGREGEGLFKKKGGKVTSVDKDVCPCLFRGKVQGPQKGAPVFLCSYSL